MPRALPRAPPPALPPPTPPAPPASGPWAATEPNVSNSLPPTPAELAHSADLECGVCLEPVLAKRGRFGLLEGCEHAFCLPCLKEWRSTHALRPDVARSCPECRAPSHFVVPSFVHFVADRKAALIHVYLTSLRSVPCRHFDYGNGTCPFGTSCFYAHTDRSGRRLVVDPRKAYGKGGATVLHEYRLSDFLFPDEARGTEAGRALLDSIPLAPPAAADEAGEEAVEEARAGANGAGDGSTL